MTSPRFRICLIEDDPIMGEALADRLGLEGFDCDWFQSGKPALLALGRKRYDVAISDVQLPDINGEALFEELRDAGVELPPYVFITGYGAIDRAVRLLKLGAEDYLTKPVDIHALLDKVRALCARSRPPAGEEPVLGISSAMRAIEATLVRIAHHPGTVLITGESGVGKEQVARLLHRCRDPAGNLPFVAVNCGALTDTLLESELFGSVRGAYTGAVKDRKGYFEQANGGTLFLDEIGDMPMAMQVKLLRAIQERQIFRVGGETAVPIELRLVCATNQNLKRMVEEGRFREDLYYRIHVIHLPIPPLRERKEDILWLAGRFLDDCAAQHNLPRRTLHRSAERALLDYLWPGNIRELKHCLERACALSSLTVLNGEALFDAVPAAPPDESIDCLSKYLETVERQYIERALRANDGRITETAAALGISRKNLWEKMRKLGLSEPR